MKFSLLLALSLFVFWTILSGKFDLLHLGAGAIASLMIALSTSRLLFMPPAIGATVNQPLSGLRWIRIFSYLPWLLLEISKSSLQIAYLALQPRLAIDPRLVRFKAHQPHTLARLILANSITLTPGTVTIDVDGDEFLVHALTEGTARSIELGKMQKRVTKLFDQALYSQKNVGIT